MIECPSCGRKHRPGTLFCNECGIYLPMNGPLGTEPILDRDMPAVKATASDTEPEVGATGHLSAILRIRILSSGREIQLPHAEDLQIGRLDAAHGIFPDLDLTPDGGLEGGVSRRHCKIYEDDGQYYVEDLGSANGTFLDGERLTPYLPHMLRHGNTLQLGRIALKIAIQG